MRSIGWKMCVALWIVMVTVGVVSLHGQEKSSEWTHDDILLAESGGDFQISPDGTRVVWVKTRMDKEKGTRISNLILRSLVDSTEIQLTRGTDSYRRPRWAPDGKTIAFLSSRTLPKKKENAASSQLWLINPLGGEPWHITEFERAIRSFDWKDPETIVFIAQEDPSLYERTVKKHKDTSRIIEDAEHEPPVRLFTYHIEKKKTTRITENDDWIRSLNVSPDGRWAVTNHQRSLSFTFDHKVPPVLFLTDLETGQILQIEPGKRILPGNVVWASDSKGFYYTTAYSDHPEYFTASINLLNYYDLAAQQVLKVDLKWENGAGYSIGATKDGFIALMPDGVRYRPLRYRKEGELWEKTEIQGDHVRNIWGWSLGCDGRTLVYDHSTAGTPTQWYGAILEGDEINHSRQITKLNPKYEKKPLYRTDIVHWKGARNDEIDGVLYYPLGYEEGKRYPLMLSIHGGPTGTDTDSWRQSYSTPLILLSQKGAFVLKVNYHGSGNYGLDWAASIGNGNYYDLERIDLINGVDYLIDRGLVDEHRVGTMGWSNGAILTTELITRYPDRFKVASAGAGDVEWISDWGNVMFGASFDNYYFGKPPYEDPRFYIKKSPYFRLPNVKTPTIIYTGTEDVNVPPSQSWSHYRVMQQATDTPVRFITFPGEPHGLRKYVHQKRKLEEDLVWFDKYLFNTFEQPDEAFKEGSPLDRRLKLRNAARDEGRYGLRVHGKLVPETVEYRDLFVGRFEVTRAQFAAFDASYSYASGTDDFPACGIPFVQAQAYIQWLSRLTGDTYRLPGSKEVEKLYTRSSGGENTLDHWAGYTPNPDDAAALMEKVAQLGGEAPLVCEVGKFEMNGDEPVFDLGGNVAEWTVGEDGQGLLMGGSADRPASLKHRGSIPGEAYRGFRVIREGKLE